MKNEPFLLELSDDELKDMLKENPQEQNGSAIEYSKTNLWLDFDENITDKKIGESAQWEKEIAAQLNLITAQLSQILKILRENQNERFL
ncbi:MAG: hypothetical protein RR253_04735 [Oscillospiraceae bacterium]